jgi:phytoene dehydrogenase-like protein
MARYDVVVIGAGLGGLTAGAILARAGRKVLVIERSNSVGGAASSYKSGDLFIEGSLHETSDPHHSRDPKHDALTRAGVIDAVKWIPGGAFYQARGGPLGEPFVLPDDFDAARRALTARFPEARAGIHQLLEEMERIASAVGTLSQGRAAFKNPRQALGALLQLVPALRDWRLSLSQKLTRVFGDHEAVKCALAANLSYYHDDPATLWWIFFATAQGGYLQSGGRFVQGGSQRLSSALARAIKAAGGEVIVRRVVSGIVFDSQGRTSSVTHTARDGGDPQTVEGVRIVSNAAPSALAALMPQAAMAKFAQHYTGRTPSISLFALTLGLSKPPREFGISAYSTQLLPREMQRLSDYAQGAALMADEAGVRMPPISIVDYAAIDSGVPSPPYVLSVVGPTGCRTGTVRTSTPIATNAGAGSRRSFAISTPFIRALRTTSWRRRSIPRCRSGNISTRPMERSTALRRRRPARSGRRPPVRRARRSPAFIWRRPMPDSAATPAWCNPPALAPT